MSKFKVGDVVVNTGVYGFLIGRVKTVNNAIRIGELGFGAMFHKDGSKYKGLEGSISCHLRHSDVRLATYEEIEDFADVLSINNFDIGDILVNTGLYGFLIGRLVGFENDYCLFDSMLEEDGNEYEKILTNEPIRIDRQDLRKATEEEISKYYKN